MIYVGIDNGVTGTITIMAENGTVIHFGTMPVKSELSYTKSRQMITRIDVDALEQLLAQIRIGKVAIERPMVNPGRFKATVSALRALEATLIVLEGVELPYEYIDSKQWQKKFLPEGLKKDELKKAAVDIARRKWPSIKTKDADSLFIAEYIRGGNDVKLENGAKKPCKRS